MNWNKLIPPESRVFVDTAVFIYYMEGSKEFGCISKELFLQPYHFVTSLITLMEVLVIPYRKENRDLIEKTYESFYSSIFSEHISISTNVLDRAARIRAVKGKVKSFDALQLASAMESNCSYFLTNDDRLPDFEGLKNIVLKRVLS